MPPHAEVISPRDLAPVEDVDKEILRALEYPVGTPCLRDIAGRGDRVAVVVSDVTRPAPINRMLPPIIGELGLAGVDRRDITVVFALGTHRNHTPGEMREIVGPRVYEQIRCVDHDPGDCQYVGTTGQGYPVEVSREVVDSDVVVCLGNIEYHYFAGYTGGAKAILPGVASHKSIEANHRYMAHPGARAGDLNDPVRRGIDEAGRMLPIDFILNTVLNDQKKLVGAVAGHYIDAHRRGCEIIDQMYRVGVEPADIVVASAGGYPKDLNLYQAHKTLENAKHAVREGGTIILVAECPEEFASKPFKRWFEEAGSIDELADRLNHEFLLGGHKASAIARIRQKANIIAVTEMPEDMTRLALMTPAGSAQEALDLALEEHDGDTRVVVLPEGGLVLPTPP